MHFIKITYPGILFMHASSRASGAQNLNTERISVIAGPPHCSREPQTSGNPRSVFILEFFDWPRMGKAKGDSMGNLPCSTLF